MLELQQQPWTPNAHSFTRNKFPSISMYTKLSDLHVTLQEMLYRFAAGAAASEPSSVHYHAQHGVSTLLNGWFAEGTQLS